MPHIAILEDYDLTLAVATPGALLGELLHTRRNPQGGSVSVPVGHVFGYLSPGGDGFNAHWHVRLFVRATVTFDPATGSTLVRAMPDQGRIPVVLSAFGSLHIRPEVPDAMVQALLRSHCTEPLFLSVHHAAEIEGKAYGQVFALE